MSEHSDPIVLFASVYAEARSADIIEPSAFCLATVDADGQPSSRMLLLKGYDERGFVFYTNLNSRKALQLASNSNAALCFFWPQIGRQVRIEGSVALVSDDEADEYFRSRDRGSQVGAWASLQSSELAGRKELLDRVADVEAQYDGIEVPRPAYWSGYRVHPRRIEFWKAGEFRLHERIVFESENGAAWRSYWLYP